MQSQSSYNIVIQMVENGFVVTYPEKVTIPEHELVSPTDRFFPTDFPRPQGPVKRINQKTVIFISVDEIANLLRTLRDNLFND